MRCELPILGYNVTGKSCRTIAPVDGILIFFMTDFVNSNGAFNVTSINILDPPVNGYNFNATITVRNPTPFTVEMVFILWRGEERDIVCLQS